MTQIMSHGHWVPYKPEKLPEFAPANALFCRRESDGVDWYEYRKDPKNFAADSVKFIVLRQEMGWTVGAAVRDLSLLPVPIGMSVLEVIDYQGADPQTELGGRLFDPDTCTLGDWLPPPPNPFEKLETRLKAIEAKLGITP